jgi:lysophospholipid acyltransferase (LPLAT)-like uncharacterized protein
MAIEHANRKARRRSAPNWIRKRAKALSRNRILVAALARLAIWYLRLVFRTNSWVVEPADALDQAQQYLPAIAGVWHGQHILLPVIPLKMNGSVMISKSLDGEITAIVAEAFGFSAIRASGGRDLRKILQKGGISGFLEMLAALERGESVLQTADIPKGIPRKAGMGIVSLARRSGRPIIPLAVASSRRLVFHGAWDRTTINLPFGKSAICMGETVHMAKDASDEEMERVRKRLEAELNRITKRAYELTGVSE